VIAITGVCWVVAGDIIAISIMANVGFNVGIIIVDFGGVRFPYAVLKIGFVVAHRIATGYSDTSRYGISISRGAVLAFINTSVYGHILAI
jgi:hypothetical protein